MCTTEEQYESIILSVNVKEVEITKSENNLIQAIKHIKVFFLQKPAQHVVPRWI